MKLSEIIALSETGTTSILIELIQPYKRYLLTYFKEYYNCPPVLIVTSVFNSCSYGFIAPANEMNEAIEVYLNADETLSEEDKESEREIINYQSIMLSNL